MSDVRDLLDALMNDYSETEFRLSCTDNIVHLPVFESVVLKVQRGNADASERADMATVKLFSVQDPSQNIESANKLSYAERTLR